mgnify:CR=1 FL=1
MGLVTGPTPRTSVLIGTVEAARHIFINHDATNTFAFERVTECNAVEIPVATGFALEENSHVTIDS